jgi:hypothetical protein
MRMNSKKKQNNHKKQSNATYYFQRVDKVNKFVYIVKQFKKHFSGVSK